MTLEKSLFKQNAQKKGQITPKVTARSVRKIQPKVLAESALVKTKGKNDKIQRICETGVLVP